ncbi:hypothetical protein CHS0354_018357 [Potamilus streckersoni]|uniref:Uncharacterized protein n=1 Tax=Potamilus streckersoni TaxID=2493646 RepID=A0AAE0W977_9BIVA|nr:hypothetical protein CHS0354_018357 [Potamilus streckersoni]
MSSKFGLTPAQPDILIRIFDRCAPVRAVKIYGSRAKGTRRDRSDVDLALYGEGIDRFTVGALCEEIEDSDLPCLVDLQSYHDIRTPALREHIDRAGQWLYQRTDTPPQEGLTSDVGQIRNGSISDSADKLNDAGIKGLKLFPAGTVLFPKSGASTFLNHRVILQKEGFVSSHLAAIKADKNILDDKYLFYFLTTVDAKNLVQASNYPSLKTTAIQKILIPLPPTEVQQKIVAKLDALFAEIDTAAAAARANAANAAALFQSYLTAVFERGDARPATGGTVKWQTVKLGDVIKFEYGKALSDKDRIIDGKYPVYGANGIKTRTNRFLYDKPTIIVGRKGSAGELVLSDEKFWVLDVSYYITQDTDKTDLMYLYYVLKTKNLSSFSKGVKPGINRNDIYQLEIPLPPTEVQQKTVSELDALSAQTDKMKAAYIQKEAELVSLKQSVLRKAFNGTLIP